MFRFENEMATMAISNNINELDILLQVCLFICNTEFTSDIYW